MPSAVWGLDIGHSSIKAVRLERAGSVAELTNFDVIEIEPGEDDNTRPERVQVAFEELLKRRRFGQPVLVAVPGNQTFFRPFALPSVASSKLDEIVRFEARQQIPFPINEVIWDFKKIAPGEEGETRVGLVAIRRELVDQVLSQIRNLGLRLEAIQVAPLALYNLVQYEFGAKDSYLVLDAGARVTDFVVVDRDEFWFRPLPQSGNDFTRALEQKFRMTYPEAEELKLKMGESKQAQKIFQVIEPMLRNLVGDIQRTIGYYKGIRKDADIQRVLAFGGTFRLPGLVDFLEQALDIQIEPMSDLSRIRIGRGVDVDWWKEEVASMGVALGLGLQGIGLSNVSMEFLPEAVLQERVLRKKRPAVAMGVGVALLAGAASLFGAQHDATIAKRDVQTIKEGLRDAKKFEGDFKDAATPVNRMNKTLATWANDTARERGWVLDVLTDLSTTTTARGEPAIGPKAAGGNGIYIKSVHVSSSPPPRAMAGPLDKSTTDWYRRITDVEGDPSRPTIGILQGEVAGGPYVMGAEDVKPASFRYVESLKSAMHSSSRIQLKGSTEFMVGSIIETAESKAKNALIFTARGSTNTQEISRNKIESMLWFRAITLGTNYYNEPALAVPKHIHDKAVNDALKKGMGDKVITRMRDYLHFTLAWVIDDGSARVNENQ